MSSVANWSYTATATIWRKLEGNDEYGDPLGYAEPEKIPCDYESGLSKKLASLGAAPGRSSRWRPLVITS